MDQPHPQGLNAAQLPGLTSALNSCVPPTLISRCDGAAAPERPPAKQYSPKTQRSTLGVTVGSPTRENHPHPGPVGIHSKGQADGQDLDLRWAAVQVGASPKGPDLDHDAEQDSAAV